MSAIFGLFITLLVLPAFSAQIDMHNGYGPMGEITVQKAFVNGDQVRIRSGIKPCPHYPGFPTKLYGDLYECTTRRDILSRLSGDAAITTLSDADLVNYLITSKYTFLCQDKLEPVRSNYEGKPVLIFSGGLLSVKGFDQLTTSSFEE